MNSIINYFSLLKIKWLSDIEVTLQKNFLNSSEVLGFFFLNKGRWQSGARSQVLGYYMVGLQWRIVRNLGICHHNLIIYYLSYPCGALNIYFNYFYLELLLLHYVRLCGSRPLVLLDGFRDHSTSENILVDVVCSKQQNSVCYPSCRKLRVSD